MARKSNNNDENLENMIFEDVSKPVKDNMEAGMEQAGSEPSVPEDFSFAEIGNDSEIGKSERSSIVGDPDSGEVFMPAEKVLSEMFKCADRTLYDLREERYEQCEFC